MLSRFRLLVGLMLINDGIPQGERLVKLNKIAIQQMQVLEGNGNKNYLSNYKT